jgi:ArsR family transcriptional regulator
MYQEIFKLHANLLKALAHPKRLEIIQLLRGQTLSVTEIQQMLDLPQANISQQLSILRTAGVVSQKKAGKQIFYKLAHQNFVKTSDLMRSVLIERYHDTDMVDELTLKMSDLIPIVSDPVCGMRLSPKTAAYGYEHNHQNYYFCASGCFEKFKSSPDTYRI